ncbi:hypothetical protein EJ04DRAFT_249422 [Polyplosphaeria fusca]|uniref:Uncharacterized protein n=1 Tax=Polyplosphaeria fusca TaxID=682080 RepID=A0A9P4QWU7_9PLEO|nr:hypothetical protein EJ04DRAFT_249422 [Polyplosphaeria fusca]
MLLVQLGPTFSLFFGCINFQALRWALGRARWTIVSAWHEQERRVYCSIASVGWHLQPRRWLRCCIQCASLAFESMLAGKPRHMVLAPKTDSDSDTAMASQSVGTRAVAEGARIQ